MEKNRDDGESSQQALRDSEERLALALSATRQGLFDLDLSTGAAVVNDQYAIMLGYDPAGFTETLDAWRNRVHGDDLEAVRAVYLDYISGRRPDYRVEFRERTRSGDWIWILSIGAVVAYDEQRKPLRLLGTRLDITERKHAERRQRETDQRLAFALEAANLGDWNMDLRTNVAWRSLQHDQCFGYKEPVQKWGYGTFLSHIIPRDRERVHARYTAAMAGQGDYDVEFEVQWPDGSFHWLWSKGRFYFDDDGKPYRVAGIVADVTLRKRTEAAVLAGESRYRLLLESSMDGILQTTSDGRIVGANPAACSMFRSTEAELLRRHRNDVVDLTDPRLTGIQETRSLTGRAQGEVWMLRSDGTRFEAEVTTALYADQDGAVLSSLVIRDITERKKAAEEIHRLAFFDPLTGLPNRRWLMDRLQLLQTSARANGLIGALLFVDLDHFKVINDARGHDVGDRLLKNVAHRLRASIGERDVIARLGGDEFIIVIADLASDFATAVGSAVERAEMLRSAIQQPIEISSHLYTPSGSIGVTFFPKQEESTDDLLREADTAMYHAKAAGRNRVALFEAAMQTEVENRLALERDLALALDDDQLSLYCQPQVDGSGQTVGAELLLRWTHPLRKAVSPEIFIPLAEESELILRIGDWVLEQACLALVKAREKGIVVPFSVNVSPKQFRQPDFVDRVRALLAATRACASQLIFEVTEGLLIENLDETIARISELANLGIRFSIDDFGTGYSSLKYLKRLPLYELKIDRSFVQDIPADAEDTAIVRAMLSIAKHLQLRVVAEGVETFEQANFLNSCGCDCLQGYLFARPMPVDRLLNVL